MEAMITGSIETSNTRTRLAYSRWAGANDGMRPIVLVHGLASSMRIWDYVAPLLAKSFEVVAYDQRGHGESQKPEVGYDLQTMVEDLDGLIQALDLGNPLVVGHSWGGTIALGYAASHPADCAGIALVDGGVADFHDWPGATWDSVSAQLAPPDLSKLTIDDLMKLTRGERVRLPHISEEAARRFFGSLMEEQPDGTIRARLSRDNHMRILRTIWDTRPDDLFGKVTCPVLAILAMEGEADERGAGEAGESEPRDFMKLKKVGAARAQALLPTLKVVWLENTIHDIPLHRPQRLSEELMDFFKSQQQ